MASGDAIEAELAPLPEAPGSPQPRGNCRRARGACRPRPAAWPEADQSTCQPTLLLGAGWGLRSLLLSRRSDGSRGKGPGPAFLGVELKDAGGIKCRGRCPAFEVQWPASVSSPAEMKGTPVSGQLPGGQRKRGPLPTLPLVSLSRCIPLPTCLGESRPGQSRRGLCARRPGACGPGGGRSRLVVGGEAPGQVLGQSCPRPVCSDLAVGAPQVQRPPPPVKGAACESFMGWC